MTLKFGKQGSPSSYNVLLFIGSGTSAVACLHELCQGHTHHLCSDCTEMKGRVAEAYCLGNNSVLIKGVILQNRKAKQCY